MVIHVRHRARHGNPQCPSNCLAIGDVTIIKNDGSIEMVEVKSSDAGSNRVTRQKQRMREVTELLKTGKGVLDEQDTTIIRLDIAPEHDLPALFGLLQEASRTGWAGKRVSDFCYIEAFDYQSSAIFRR